MQYVNDFRVPIEICVTSNVQTRVVSSFAEHPLRRYYDAGLVLSDNRLMSATTVTDEYWRAHEHLGFTWEELVDIAQMGFQSSFMHREEKQAMIEKVREEIQKLEAE
jgi:adenosine deaminase